MKKNARQLFRLAKQALLNAGAHEAMAGTAAQHLLRAEEQGMSARKSCSDPIYQAIIAFPKMNVAVATHGARVAEIRYLPPAAATKDPENALAERAARQLERYRDDPDAQFDLPLAIAGTPFQRSAWQAMRAIARGRTRTYGELARELGGEARAVGQACGDNRLPIVIPCHRVVAADGIGGFAHATDGYLIEAKRWLLLHETQADAFALRP